MIIGKQIELYNLTHGIQTTASVIVGASTEVRKEVDIGIRASGLDIVGVLINNNLNLIAEGGRSAKR